MKVLRDTYFSIQTTLFPMFEDEKKREPSDKMEEFWELLEVVRPA